MFDLSKLSKVERANRKTVAARPQFDLRFNPKTSKFLVGDKFFEDYNLKDNGFTQFNSPDSKDIFISVQPDKSSVFLKRKTEENEKGKQFKNVELAEDLIERGLGKKETVGYYNLQPAGEQNGMKFFQIVPISSTGTVAETAEEDEVMESSAESVTSDNSQNQHDSADAMGF